MKTKILLFSILACLTLSCQKVDNNSPKDVALKIQNKGHELIAKMVATTGDFNELLSKKDVSYIYTDENPDGKRDIAIEKYIFEKELSYGRYNQHEKTLPQYDGLIEQGFDGTGYWLKHDGENVTDKKSLKKVAFNRATNFYWFTMMQKLLDPGLNYEFIGEKIIDDIIYDIVKITFNSQPDKPSDIFQVYINRKTALIDQFLFTVADFGIMETPNLMKLEYEEIEGMLIPTKRQYKKSDWNANVSDKAWIDVRWTNIKFNNGYTIQDFKK